MPARQTRRASTPVTATYSHCTPSCPRAAPGDIRPARFTLVVTDPIWTWLYQPFAGAIEFASLQLNHLQFLTIRRYLSLVFYSLVALSLVLAIWS